jgi:hypothetical protein
MLDINAKRLVNELAEPDIQISSYHAGDASSSTGPTFTFPQKNCTV